MARDRTVGRTRRFAWSVAGAAALIGSVAACAPAYGGGGQSCTTATPIIGGYPSVGATPPVVGWYTSDTRTTGLVEVSTALGAPAGFGCNSVHMTTGANTQISGVYQDKAQLFSYEKAGTALSAVTDLGYWVKKDTPGPATIALNVQITGPSVPGNFATLVYEPYNQSTGNGGVLLNTWQHWDATATTPGDGVWWSTKISSGPGSQASPQSWAAMQALYNDATLGGYGFNLGSNNPNQNAAADGLTLNSTTTDF